MPTSDYWFLLEYNDFNTGEPKQLRAHFTLKKDKTKKHCVIVIHNAF